MSSGIPDICLFGNSLLWALSISVSALNYRETGTLKVWSPLTGNLIGICKSWNRMDWYSPFYSYFRKLREHPFFQGHFVLFLNWTSNFLHLNWSFEYVISIDSCGYDRSVALLSPQFILDVLSLIRIDSFICWSSLFLISSSSL